MSALTLVEFILMALATVLAFIPSAATTLAAIAIVTAVYLVQRKRAAAVPRQEAAATVRPR